MTGGVCVSCQVRFRNTVLRDGHCSQCWDTEFVTRNAPKSVLSEAARLAVNAYPRGPVHFDAAKATDDLRWLWNESSSAIGIRSGGATSGVITVKKDDAGNDDASDSGATCGRFVQVPVRDFSPSEAELRAAQRLNRIMEILADVPHKDVRILQRRFEQHYYMNLDVYFGEWSGVVDYISDVGDRLDPRNGKQKIPKRQIEALITKAKKVVDGSLAIYVASAIRCIGTARRSRVVRLLGVA